MKTQAPRMIEIAIVVIFCVLTGCASPATRFDVDAKGSGFERQMAGGLVLYQKGLLVDGQPIHFYIDGDGTPSLGHGRISQDPTSRNRLILDLIRADISTSVLVGRPCYYGGSNRCSSEQWTTARYSKDVVDQLLATINGIIRRFPESSITLIGYSGGGALAMLAAPGLDRVDTLITVAANLDTRAWVEHHGYAPLIGSLNPADQAPLPTRIKQYHFFGADDENVPVGLSRRVLDRQGNANTKVVPGFSHTCCWPNIWTSSMRQIAMQIASVD
ncbi:MAG: alpha/beta hydrolase [Proteobacteria bacterium]|nr:alpha/beta hydrolase [Pseudomonadota bacterium]